MDRPLQREYIQLKPGEHLVDSVGGKNGGLGAKMKGEVPTRSGNEN